MNIKLIVLMLMTLAGYQGTYSAPKSIELFRQACLVLQKKVDKWKKQNNLIKEEKPEATADAEAVQKDFILIGLLT